MTAKKPYEMSFVEFAEAIEPSWGASLGSSTLSSDSPDWLTSVWSSADKRGIYHVFWHNEPLKNELPPETQKYQFDDLSLYPITARLGLNPEIEKDNIKASMLLAVRNAWITAIQHHYDQSTTTIPSCTLTNAAATEYVLLTSGLVHPWIKEQVIQHIEEQNRKKLELAGQSEPPVEMSDDPNWPNTRVIHVRATECPHEQAWREDQQARLEEEMKDIRYWVDLFRHKDGGWASRFEMDAWSAQCDIDVANQKIIALQKVIEKQKALIQSTERIISKNKRHEAAMRKSKKIGRPEKSPERQEVALKFTSQWVQSLMDALKMSNSAQLESAIDGSSQRNWRRWLNGQAVPTRKKLSELLNAEITQGSYKGKSLHDVTTIPKHNDLLSLISLT